MSRLAALLLLAVCAGAAWLDSSAPTARALRERRPVWAAAALRHEGQNGVLPPAVYLFLLDPHRRALTLILVPAGTPLSPDGTRTLADAYGEALRAGASAEAASSAAAAAAAEAARAAPGWPASRPLFSTALILEAAARPGDPLETARRLGAAAADPFLWLRFPALARAPGAPGPWEAASLLRAARAVPAGSLRAARWPAPELAGAFARHLIEGDGAGDRRGVVTIEVLNAGAEPGVALRATKVLRLAGFDVVHFGNAPAAEERTWASDRAGRPEAARAALAALGCRRAGTLTALEAGPLTMVSVTVGRDWRDCAALGGATREEG